LIRNDDFFFTQINTSSTSVAFPNFASEVSFQLRNPI
jgi:hypothetical protein